MPLLSRDGRGPQKRGPETTRAAESGFEVGSGDLKLAPVLLSAAHREPDTTETQEHHRPGSRLRHAATWRVLEQDRRLKCLMGYRTRSSELAS